MSDSEEEEEVKIKTNASKPAAKAVSKPAAKAKGKQNNNKPKKGGADDDEQDEVTKEEDGRDSSQRIPCKGKKHSEYKIVEVTNKEPMKKKGFFAVDVFLEDDTLPVVTSYSNMEVGDKVIFAP